MRQSAAIFAIFLVLFASMVPLIGSAGSDNSSENMIKTVVKGPTEVLTGEKYEYTIYLQALDSTLEVDKWGVNISVEGGSASPMSENSTTSSVFKVNVTAPLKEGEFTITVNGTADVGNKTYWNKVDYKVNAVNPYVIKAKLHNSGNVEAKNVEVSLYIDGKFQYRTTVDLKPQEDQTVELKFNPNDFSDGPHKAKIVIDDSNHLTFLNNGNAETTFDIYIGEMHEDHTSTWIALAILFGAGAIYSVYSYQKKKKRMKRRKW
jgi:hypothetical protein